MFIFLIILSTSKIFLLFLLPKVKLLLIESKLFLLLCVVLLLTFIELLLIGPKVSNKLVLLLV